MILVTRDDAAGPALAREVMGLLAERFLDELELHALAVDDPDAAVASGKADVTVLPVDGPLRSPPPGLTATAIPARPAPVDVLVSEFAFADLPRGGRVAASGLRRRAQVLHARGDLAVDEAGPDLADALRRWRSGEFDGLVVSAADLRRAAVEASREALNARSFVPDPGQGALACACKPGSRFEEFLAGIDDARTRTEVSVEKQVLRGLGGDARFPIGVHATARGAEINVRAIVLSPDGRRAVTAAESVSARDPLYGADELAEKLVRMGADVLIAEGRKLLP